VTVPPRGQSSPLGSNYVVKNWPLFLPRERADFEAVDEEGKDKVSEKNEPNVEIVELRRISFFWSATPCASPPPSIFFCLFLSGRDDRHLLAHAMASDFSVAWQCLSKRTVVGSVVWITARCHVSTSKTKL
jgi:hypothetical protein